MFLFLPARKTQSVTKNEIPVGKRNLCFQTQRRESVKERITSSEVLRDHYKDYRLAVRSEHILE